MASSLEDSGEIVNDATSDVVGKLSVTLQILEHKMITKTESLSIQTRIIGSKALGRGL